MPGTLPTLDARSSEARFRVAMLLFSLTLLVGAIVYVKEEFSALHSYGDESSGGTYASCPENWWHTETPGHSNEAIRSWCSQVCTDSQSLWPYCLRTTTDQLGGALCCPWPAVKYAVRGVIGVAAAATSVFMLLKLIFRDYAGRMFFASSAIVALTLISVTLASARAMENGVSACNDDPQELFAFLSIDLYCTYPDFAKADILEDSFFALLWLMAAACYAIMRPKAGLDSEQQEGIFTVPDEQYVVAASQPWWDDASDAVSRLARGRPTRALLVDDEAELQEFMRTSEEEDPQQQASQQQQQQVDELPADLNNRGRLQTEEEQGKEEELEQPVPQSPLPTPPHSGTVDHAL